MTSTFDELRDRFFRFALEHNPVTSTFLGGDGWDATLVEAQGRLRDYRPEALAQEVVVYRDVARQLDSIDPSGLAPQDRIDHALIAAQVAFLLHHVHDLRYQERSVDTYVAEPFRGVDWQLQQMTLEPDGTTGTGDEWRAVLARLRAIPGYISVARDNLRAGLASGNAPDQRMIDRDGVGGSRDNAEYFGRTLPRLASEYLSPRASATSLLADIGIASARAADAFLAVASFMEELPPPESDRFAIGEAEYEWRTRNNLRDERTAQQLWDYGGEQVAEYQDRIFGVVGEIGRARSLATRFDTSGHRAAAVRTVIDALGLDSPRDDDERLAWYVDTGRRAVEYGREQGLFDIPDGYRLDVVPTPPVLRGIVEAAYYPAAPLKPSGVGRFYLTPTGNDPAALALNNRASVASVAAHEGFPGHDWHYRYIAEHGEAISNVRWLTPGAVEDSSSMWSDSMSMEGWGLYAEALMAEGDASRPHGFYSTEEYLYQLLWGLLRAVRVRVDVGIHTGRMRFSEAVDYQAANQDFMPNAGRDADHDAMAYSIYARADRATYRYSKWPTQAITYNLGMNAIAALRQTFLRRTGDRNPRGFHEWFMGMGMGMIPAAYFRDAT